MKWVHHPRSWRLLANQSTKTSTSMKKSHLLSYMIKQILMCVMHRNNKVSSTWHLGHCMRESFCIWSLTTDIRNAEERSREVAHHPEMWLMITVTLKTHSGYLHSQEIINAELKHTICIICRTKTYNHWMKKKRDALAKRNIHQAKYISLFIFLSADFRGSSANVSKIDQWCKG